MARGRVRGCSRVPCVRACLMSMCSSALPLRRRGPYRTSTTSGMRRRAIDRRWCPEAPPPRARRPPRAEATQSAVFYFAGDRLHFARVLSREAVESPLAARGRSSEGGGKAEKGPAVGVPAMEEVLKAKTWGGCKGGGELLIGLVLDAACAGRKVERGPPAEDAEAARRFRKFWGAKSEVRCVRGGEKGEGEDRETTRENAGRLDVKGAGSKALCMG